MIAVVPRVTRIKTTDHNRQLVINAVVLYGAETWSVARDFGVPIRSVNRWLKEFRDLGKVAKEQQGGRKTKVLNQDMIDFVQGLIDDRCEITLLEIQEQLEAVCLVFISTSCINVYIADFNYSFKRTVTRVIAADTPVNLAARLEFCHWLQPLALMNRNIIFIDETGFQVSTRVKQGRAKKGVAPVIVTDQIRSRNITAIASISRAGYVNYN
jgi:transposase